METPILNAQDRMIDLKALAHALNVGYSFTRAMKKAGLSLPGGKTTVRDARRWLRNNPDFKPSRYFPRKAS